MVTGDAGAAVRAARGDEVEGVTAMLVLAFAADPAMRFLLPDAARYREHAPAMIAAGARLAVAQGTLDLCPDHAGAAMWFPPGSRLSRAETTPLLQRAVEPERLPEVAAGMAAGSGDFDPGGPCFYLQMIGVDPLRQRHGIGSSLLRHGLSRIDALGARAYLQCSNAHNVALYERHGFEVRCEGHIAPDVPLWQMVRDPRAR